MALEYLCQRSVTSSFFFSFTCIHFHINRTVEYLQNTGGIWFALISAQPVHLGLHYRNISPLITHPLIFLLWMYKRRKYMRLTVDLSDNLMVDFKSIAFHQWLKHYQHNQCLLQKQMEVLRIIMVSTIKGLKKK